MIAISESALWKKRLGDWVINPFVGCEHGCMHCYCPAMPGVKFHNGKRTQREWGSYLIPKAGIVQALEAQLRRFIPSDAKVTAWGDGWVLMSFLTDCYTPAEAKLRITRQCLQRLLEAGHKVRLQTRSVLVERDFDLLKAHKEQVLLGTSLPHLDDKLARTLEPRASGPTRRLRMLRKAVDCEIPIYVAVAPFMPFHDEAILDTVLSAVGELAPREIFCEVLNPKGDNVAMMADVLDGEFPEFATVLRSYDAKAWAKFTFRILSAGLKKHPRFVAWPDTQRRWKTHLTPAQTAFLDQYLPAVDMSATAQAAAS